eukprot:6702459-Prymnesium_polylepis.3
MGFRCFDGLRPSGSCQVPCNGLSILSTLLGPAMRQDSRIAFSCSGLPASPHARDVGLAVARTGGDRIVSLASDRSRSRSLAPRMA